MSKEFWGYILLSFIISNGLTWLFGWELDTKDKLILPNVFILAIIGIGFALILMGAEI